MQGMQGIQTHFLSYKPSSHGSVHVAGGSFIQVLGEQSINIPYNPPLSFILNVSQFPHNLISFSTKSNNCSITFFLYHCVLRDLKTGQKSSGGYETNGLYLLYSPKKS